MCFYNHHATRDDLIVNVAVTVLHVENILERLQEGFIKVKVWQFRLLDEQCCNDVMNVFDCTFRYLTVFVASRLLKAEDETPGENEKD